MTTFLNLMVVLVPFLLITAVFSRITIVELSLPSSAGGAAPEQPSFRMEVVVRDAGLEITNGRSVIATLPKVDGDYDLPKLSELVVSLKRSHPGQDSASVLLEPQIEYDHLIQVMDVVRSVEQPREEGEEEQPPVQVALFPDISIGGRAVKNTRRIKRMTRNRARPKGMPLTSLMDVFTILVFFLLVNSANTELLEDAQADHAAGLQRGGEAPRNGRDLREPGDDHRAGRSGGQRERGVGVGPAEHPAGGRAAGGALGSGDRDPHPERRRQPGDHDPGPTGRCPSSWSRR